MAAEKFPELAEELTESDSPMYWWIQLGHAFNRAYEEPRDEGMICRVYKYADWCLEQEQPDTLDAGQHLLTCVAVAFWEDIPRNPAARADMPRWFTYQEILLNRPFFSYHLTDSEFEELLALFPHSNRRKDRRESKRRKRKGKA